MKRIVGLVGLIIIFGGGFYYYHTYKKNIQDPVKQYEKISELAPKEQVVALQKTVSKWIEDPVSQIPYPKGWQKVSVTTQGYTFDVVTPDEANPPQYYVSFVFPKKLISKMNLIKCLNIGSKEKTTDVCVVGDNPTINAYFTMVGWLKTFSANQLKNIESLTPTVSPE